MNNTPNERSGPIQRYRDRTRRSGQLAAAARQIYPSGITHDIRHLDPYSIYVERAEGPLKWDVDGNRYIDYIGGHGGHIAGHSHPDIVTAVQAAIARGTQLGGNTAEEVEYGRLLRDMVPCAERIRITMSGTEATLLALRLARAYTGKNRIIQVRTNFHGWHDQLASGYMDFGPGSVARGIVPAIAEYAVPVPPGDLDAMAEALSGDDIAAVILEPTGTHFGQIPLPPGYLEMVRELSAANAVVLIFDEVITGFRIGPGGAQGHYGITPDLSTHAKIICGGLPGGAVCGAKDILDVLDFAEMAARGEEKVSHNGTFNANLISTAAGIAMMKLVRDDDVCGRASAAAARLRNGLNELLSALALPWAVYGEFSGFFLFTNPDGVAIDPLNFDPHQFHYKALKGSRTGNLVQNLLITLLNNGVHIAPFPGGFVSASHTDDVVDETVDRFALALQDIPRP